MTYNVKGFPISFIKDVIKDETHCGQINPKFFQIIADLFDESQLANNCLYRKIGFDKHGNVKNCSSSGLAFGNYLNDDFSFIDIISTQEFQKMWYVNKDLLKDCSVCEYRYMFTDCRVYIKDDYDNLSKQKKCNYDPYTASWVN